MSRTLCGENRPHCFLYIIAYEIWYMICYVGRCDLFVLHHRLSLIVSGCIIGVHIILWCVLGVLSFHSMFNIFCVRHAYGHTIPNKYIGLTKQMGWFQYFCTFQMQLYWCWCVYAYWVHFWHELSIVLHGSLSWTYFLLFANPFLAIQIERYHTRRLGPATLPRKAASLTRLEGSEFAMVAM